MTNSDIFAGLSRGQFLSKSGNCQTFDNDADGYCRGDSIGSLVIKRLDDALADNDRILGVVLNTATNHSANAISITHPHTQSQETLFRKVMDDAGIDPHDVSYVEMHGTGTQAGDGIEMRSVTNVFAPASRIGTRKKLLHLGSVKANVGHGEAASGVTAMIKCLLMMQNDTIPPHCGIKQCINTSFPQDLSARNVHIAFKPTPFLPRDGSPRRIFLNNFSAAGGNTALLLEDAPDKPPLMTDSRRYWPITMSAKSQTALHANTRNLLNHIKEHSHIRIPDLSYTTTARKIQYEYRIGFSCDSLSKAVEVLESISKDPVGPVPKSPPKVAFAYTGQGSHYTALGKQLYELSKHFRSDVEDFDNISCMLGFPSFLSLLKGDVDARTLPPVPLQIGLTCIQMALTRLWASWGIKPDVVIGHSLGEYAALNAAGVIAATETIYLVGERARLLQNHCTAGSHAMLATKASTIMSKQLLHECPKLEIACVNGAHETVLSGIVNDVERAAEISRLQGTRCTKLNVQFAFHSSQVEVITSKFEDLARFATFKKPEIPIISPLLADVLCEVDCIDEKYLARHARETVDFSGGLKAAQQRGFINEQTVFIELGPDPVCLNFLRSELGRDIVTGHSLRKGAAPYKTISESLCTLHEAGLSIDWNEYHRDFLDCLQMLDLPTYAFDNKNYWIQYTGDWNLRKGQVVEPAVLPEIEKPKLSTTTVQRLISEVVDHNKATIIFESDIAQPELLAAISGHVVNGTLLCPSSIYSDMALTAGKYLYELLRSGIEIVDINVCNMEVFKPFVVNGSGGKGQTIRLTATTPNINSGRAGLVFSSGSGKTEVQHAECHIDFGSGLTWLAEWRRSAYLINGRIDGLIAAASIGGAHRMLRGMVYKLFGALVNYDPKYRGMEEVILDSSALEATAHIAFQTTEADGNFVCNPYWIDSVCHLAGFIVNANDAIDSTQDVYVSHGWESMRFAEPLQANKTYRSYVKMQPLTGNMVSGDVYILSGEKIVGLCGSLKFQRIPRKLLDTLLRPKCTASQEQDDSATTQAPLNSIKSNAANTTASEVATSYKSSFSVTDKILEIVASEIGVSVTELADPTDFVSLGVDSLMSLSICGKIREEIDVDAPASLFVGCPTVGALKRHFSQCVNSDSTGMEETSSGSSTPSLRSEKSSQVESIDTPMSPPGTPGSPADAKSLSMIIQQIISEEMGVEIAELSLAADLSALGMDSLMSLSILGKLHEKAGLTLPANFLVDNQTVDAIESALHIRAPSSKSSPGSKNAVLTAPAPQKQGSLISQTAKVKKPLLPDRSASSILLQGDPQMARETLWLVPDGGGSPTSYVFLDEISPKLVVWGLTSPFCRTPKEYNCGIVGIASKFIQEIRRRQPEGPYHVGGWSAGGVISFEIVRQLIETGDMVKTLIFIDTPCPLIIEPLPSNLHRFFGSIGLLGEGDGALEKLPPWLLPHFAASVHALSTYDALRVESVKCPKVFAIWCEDGVCKEPDDPRPDPYPYGHAQWLLENRTDFGTNLWEEYLDESKIITRHMPGNHFSMMKAPFVDRLTGYLKEALYGISRTDDFGGSEGHKVP